MRIIFFGTPDFATESLINILNSKHDVVGVVTAVDKPAGRHLKIRPSPVKEMALRYNIPILQPLKLKDEKFLKELHNLNADIFVVVAFRILPEVVWNLPKFGSINLHPSLLPDYRGAAPINWAVINGEKQTGITIFFLAKKVDTGSIITQTKIPIPDDANASYMYEILKKEGAKLLTNSLDIIETKDFVPRPQDTISDNYNKAPKIYLHTCELDFSKSCIEVHNKIRGLSDYPCAFTSVKKIKLKILKSHYELGKQSQAIGEIVTNKKSYFGIVCNDGIIFFDMLKPENKKQMEVKDFLNGYKDLL